MNFLIEKMKKKIDFEKIAGPWSVFITEKTKKKDNNNNNENNNETKEKVALGSQEISKDRR